MRLSIEVIRWCRESHCPARVGKKFLEGNREYSNHTASQLEKTTAPLKTIGQIPIILPCQYDIARKLLRSKKGMIECHITVFAPCILSLGLLSCSMQKHTV